MGARHGRAVVALAVLLAGPAAWAFTIDLGPTAPPGAPAASGGGGAVSAAQAVGDPPQLPLPAGNGTDGRGKRMCYTPARYSEIYGSAEPVLPYTSLIRVALSGSEPPVPAAAGGLPTADEVAAWAAARFVAAGMDAENTLIPQDLSDQFPSNDWVDAKGIRHVRLVQYNTRYNATVSVGPQVVHLFGGNFPFFITGGVHNVPKSARALGQPATGPPRLTPPQGAAAAVRAALDAAPDAPAGVRARLRAAAASPDRGSLLAAEARADTPLVVYCSSAACDLAYEQVIFLPRTRSAGPRELHIYVSAHDGRVLLRADGLRTYAQAAVGSGRGLYVGRGAAPVPLRTADDTAQSLTSPRRFMMWDTVWASTTNDLKGKGPYDPGALPQLFRDGDDAWGDGTPKSRATVAVDAHWGMGVTLDYYKKVHGRNSIDNRGAPVEVNVHVMKGYNNAFYRDKKAYFGDGSLPPRKWLSGCSDGGLPPLVSLDVIAHELSHGVTEYTSDLFFLLSSGGINEALSDIMAMCVLDYAHAQGLAPAEADFLIGAQMLRRPNCTNRPFVRSMVDPVADGGSWSCWDPMFDRTDKLYISPFNSEYRCEVDSHWSSGVANRAFWLMTRGLTDCHAGSLPLGIGFDKSCKVFHRASVAYLGRTSDFYELRQATLMAAQDLYGATGAEAAAVTAAWDAVGAPRRPYPNPDAPTCDPYLATDPQRC